MASETNRHLTVLATGAARNSARILLTFGAPVRRCEAADGRQLCVFTPGQVFGFEARKDSDVRGEYRRVFVVRCGRPGEVLSVLPAVHPGAHILVSGTGKRGAERVAAMLEKLSGMDERGAIPAERWQVLGARLVTGLPVEPEEFFP
jgi:hypothetical protein